MNKEKQERTEEEIREGALIGFLDVINTLFGTGVPYKINEKFSRRRDYINGQRAEREIKYLSGDENKNGR